MGGRPREPSPSLDQETKKNRGSLVPKKKGWGTGPAIVRSAPTRGKKCGEISEKKAQSAQEKRWT